MTKFSFSDIETAFEYVGSAEVETRTAILCKDTGEIYFQSETAGIDEVEEAEENLNWDECLEIPHKNELNLGRDLVFEFIEKHLSHEYDRVQYIFRQRGAYSRYKDLLDRKKLLQKWYDFENTRQTQAIRNWCAENEIDLDG